MNNTINTNQQDDKETLFASSCYNQKYYFNSKFSNLPTAIQDELRSFIVPLTAKIHGIIEVGFYTDDGEIYIETSCEEADHRFDEIGAKLEVDRLLRVQKEFFRQIALWYQLTNITKS